MLAAVEVDKTIVQRSTIHLSITRMRFLHFFIHHLDTLQWCWLLEVSLDLLTRIVLCALTMQTQQRTQIELWCLQQLYLPDMYVLERVDALCRLFNLATDQLWDQLLCQLRQCAACSLLLDDLGHLLADGTDLRRGGVRGLLDLVRAALGEGDREESEEVIIGCLDGDVGFDQSLPLADEGTELIGGEVEAVEVGQAVLSLDFVDAELDLAEGVVLVLLEIGQRHFEDATFEGVVGVLETGGSVYEGLADTVRTLSDIVDMCNEGSCALSDVECGGSLD